MKLGGGWILVSVVSMRRGVAEDSKIATSIHPSFPFPTLHWHVHSSRHNLPSCTDFHDRPAAMMAPPPARAEPRVFVAYIHCFAAQDATPGTPWTLLLASMVD